MNVRPGTGVGGAGIDETVRICLAPCKQLSRSRRCGLYLVGVVFEQRPGRHERDCNTVVPGEFLHPRCCRLIVGNQVRKLRCVGRKHLFQHALFDAGRQKIRPGQHHVDVAASRALHRLQLTGQFWCRRLGEINLGDEVRVLLLKQFNRILRQRQIAGDVDDVERHWRSGLSDGRQGDNGTDGRNTDRRGNGAQQRTPSGSQLEVREFHGTPPIC